MDNKSDKTISFSSDGFCNYCSDVLKRKESEYFPDFGENKLEEIFKTIKKESKECMYDCICGISGGLDSSYIMYLGYKFGLRILAIHIDDGLDNPVAVENINRLVNKTGSKYISIKPNIEEYTDILLSLFKASVPNLAIAQDNLIIHSLQDYGEKNGIKYILDGSNFAHECILERDKYGVNTCDKKFILNIQKKFGSVPIKELQFESLTDRYLRRNANKQFKHVRPLNYINYNMEDAISTLETFCGFQYYGGKHYESILTRYMQLHYLPVKFGIDKRKSHYSSLIISNQMSREKAEELLKQPLSSIYTMKNEDEEFLAKYMNITIDELRKLVSMPPKKETDYPNSILNKAAPLARKMRSLLE